MTCYGPSRVTIRRKSIIKGRRLAYEVTVPCGSCLGCRTEQGRQWAVRIMHEKQMFEHAWFVTFTYSDDRIPKNGTLCAKHLQKFVKDLRQDIAKYTHAPEVSYYACGEYGERTQRPHYHAALFGVDFVDRLRHPDDSRIGVWRSDTLEEIWGRGMVEFGSLTMASASYIAAYVRKKVGLTKEPDHYLRVDIDTGELIELDQEFARMSLRPAIGRRWIEKFWRDVYPRDFVVIDGFEAKPPRYYDKYMDLLDEKGGSSQRRNIMEEVRQKRYDQAVELDKYQLKAKKRIHEGRHALYAQRNTL